MYVVCVGEGGEGEEGGKQFYGSNIPFSPRLLLLLPNRPYACDRFKVVAYGVFVCACVRVCMKIHLLSFFFHFSFFPPKDLQFVLQLDAHYRIPPVSTTDVTDV